MENILTDIFDGKIGQVPAGLCKLSFKGKIAVNTTSGFKTFDPAEKRLVNVKDFAMDLGSGSFFLIPVKKVEAGDNILIKRGNIVKPYCVIEPENEEHKGVVIALDYQEGTEERIIPERHFFMEKEYLFGKIVSIWSFLFKNGAEGGLGKFGKMMAFSKFFGGKQNNMFANFNLGNMTQILPFMLMKKIGGNDSFDISKYMMIQAMQGNGGQIDFGQIFLMEELFKEGDQDVEGLSSLFGGFLDDFGF